MQAENFEYSIKSLSDITTFAFGHASFHSLNLFTTEFITSLNSSSIRNNPPILIKPFPSITKSKYNGSLKSWNYNKNRNNMEKNPFIRVY